MRRPVEKSVGQVKGEEKKRRMERRTREEEPPRRRLGEVVGCIVGNGNSRDTKSTVQLANFPGRRRCDVAAASHGIASEDSLARPAP